MSENCSFRLLFTMFPSVDLAVGCCRWIVLTLRHLKYVGATQTYFHAGNLFISPRRKVESVVCASAANEHKAVRVRWAHFMNVNFRRKIMDLSLEKRFKTPSLCIVDCFSAKYYDWMWTRRRWPTTATTATTATNRDEKESANDKPIARQTCNMNVGDFVYVFPVDLWTWSRADVKI